MQYAEGSQTRRSIRLLSLVPILILTTPFVNCSTTYRQIQFNPDLRIMHHEAQGMGDIGTERFIPFSDDQINKYACMSEEKIKQLARLIHRCVIPEGL